MILLERAVNELGSLPLIGSKILSCECINLDLPQDTRCRQEEDSFYGLKIVTAKGVCDIVFRNSSNGYYGGYLKHTEYRQAFHIIKEMEQIEDDWSA
jgi:hypothetical protein